VSITVCGRGVKKFEGVQIHPRTWVVRWTWVVRRTWVHGYKGR